MDPRFAIDPDAPERTLLEEFLEFQRSALLRKCEGLTDEQLTCVPIASAPLMSLAGLVRHLATVERWYFRAVVADDFPGSLYDHESDAAFTDASRSSRSEAFGTWNREIAASRAVAETHELADRFPLADGHVVTLRWVFVHMIDEYARHLGHADLLRQAIDGRAGE